MLEQEELNGTVTAVCGAGAVLFWASEKEILPVEILHASSKQQRMRCRMFHLATVWHYSNISVHLAVSFFRVKTSVLFY